MHHTLSGIWYTACVWRLNNGNMLVLTWWCAHKYLGEFIGKAGGFRVSAREMAALILRCATQISVLHLWYLRSGGRIAAPSYSRLILRSASNHMDNVIAYRSVYVVCCWVLRGCFSSAIFVHSLWCDEIKVCAMIGGFRGGLIIWICALELVNDEKMKQRR